MILTWLGSFLLVLVGFSFTQKYFSELFTNFKDKLLSNLEGQSFLKSFISLVFVTVSEMSPQKTLQTSLNLLNHKKVNYKSHILLICLSPLGAWLALLLAILFMNFNGLFLLGLGSFGLLNALRSTQMAKYLKLLVTLGLFFIGGDLMFKNTSVFLNSFADSEIIFFLADGRFSSVLVMMAASLLMTIVIQIEYWTLFLALSLVFVNVLSMNGALGLVAGEQLGVAILFWLQTRTMNPQEQRMGHQFAVVSVFASILGLLAAGELRTYLAFGYGDLGTSLQDKNLQFLFLFTVILILKFTGQMAWGHFFCQSQSFASKT